MEELQNLIAGGGAEEYYDGDDYEEHCQPCGVPNEWVPGTGQPRSVVVQCSGLSDADVATTGDCVENHLPENDIEITEEMQRIARERIEEKREEEKKVREDKAEQKAD